MSRLTSHRSGVTYVLNSDTVGRATTTTDSVSVGVIREETDAEATGPLGTGPPNSAGGPRDQDALAAHGGTGDAGRWFPRGSACREPGSLLPAGRHVVLQIDDVGSGVLEHAILAVRAADP